MDRLEEIKQKESERGSIRRDKNRKRARAREVLTYNSIGIFVGVQGMIGVGGNGIDIRGTRIDGVEIMERVGGNEGSS